MEASRDTAISSFRRLIIELFELTSVFTQGFATEPQEVPDSLRSVAETVRIGKQEVALAVCPSSMTTELSQGSAIEPRGVIDSLRTIAKSLRVGRQEDAHEFLRLLTEGLDECPLALPNGMHAAIGKEKNKEEGMRPGEGSVAKAVFGGAVRSEVTCPKVIDMMCVCAHVC